MGIIIYSLLQTQSQEPSVGTTVTKVKYINPPRDDDERRFETERFLHPMIPPLRRGPFNLGPGGMDRNRYGYDGGFNQMGYIQNTDNNDQAMPLMGRRLHSQQYEYYTFHHNNPDIKIPIKIQGDKEILDGDTVNVANYPPGVLKASIYELDTPRYVPY